MSTIRWLLIVIVLLLSSGFVIAQETTDEPEPGINQTFDATGTQLSIDATTTRQSVIATQTQEAVIRQATNVAATQTQVYFATASATALTPMPTERFPNFSISLNVDPPSSDGTYEVGNEITFNLLVANQGGGTTLNDRNIVVVVPFNTEVFAEPSAGTISDNGQFANGTIKWTLNLVEGTSQNLTVTARIRDTIQQDLDTEVRAIIRTGNEQVILRQSDIRAFKILSRQEPEIITSVSDKATQGSGLFQSESSFAMLIGGFFTAGILLIFGLGLFSIRNTTDSDHIESMFRSTTEILLLLIVLFSVIVMGVQNAIDRESINAIIGGIVGYVAGRVTSSSPRIADIVKAVRGDNDNTSINGNTPSGNESTEK